MHFIDADILLETFQQVIEANEKVDNKHEPFTDAERRNVR